MHQKEDGIVLTRCRMCSEPQKSPRRKSETMNKVPLLVVPSGGCPCGSVYGRELITHLPWEPERCQWVSDLDVSVFPMRCPLYCVLGFAWGFSSVSSCAANEEVDYWRGKLSMVAGGRKGKLKGWGVFWSSCLWGRDCLWDRSSREEVKQ